MAVGDLTPTPVDGTRSQHRLAAFAGHLADTLGYNDASQFMTPAENSMARILVAECKQEVSTFNPVASRYEDFRVVRGAAALDYHRTIREEVGGALSVFGATEGVELVPAIMASSITSGGVLAAESFDRLSGDFL